MAIETKMIDPHQVVCDGCNKNWSDLTESGGILFGSKAYCPDCMPGLEQSIQEHGEDRFIKDRCPVGVSYADWVRGIRGPAPCVTTYTGEDFTRQLKRLSDQKRAEATRPDYSED